MTFPSSHTIADFGGEMADYKPVEDPTTDLGAALFNKMSASVAALSHISPRAWCVLVGHATTPTINEHDSAWGSAPSVKPTVAHSGTGHYLVTWGATQTDELGDTYTLNLKSCHVNARGSALFHCQASTASANTVDVYTFDSTGAADDAAGVAFDLWVA